ncbi:MAG: hypothetical protein FJX76_01755 [Armatimonadetes bacterium]|nr:hypothetical protein [Armatimonadota bacterium]
MQLHLLGLENLFGAGKPLYAPIVPYTSAMATRSRGLVMVNAFDMVGANQEMKGSVPTARYHYHDFHGGIARNRKVFDVVFRQIIPGRFTATKALPPPTKAIQASYQKALGRPPTAAEVSAEQTTGKSLQEVRKDLESSVEFVSKGIPKGAAFVSAWRRNGGEKALGRPVERAVEVGTGSGRWVMWMNPPDSGAAVLMRTPTSGPFLVRGPIAMQYFAVADFNDRYGFPTGDEARSEDTVRQSFEKGEMVLEVKTGTVTWRGK